MAKKHSLFFRIDIILALIWCLIPVLPVWASGPTYPVIRVVDGDTISILYQGKTEKIRLLNVDTPESVHPDPSRNTPLGKKASSYTRSRLSGKRVALEFEDRKRGKYGRLLAYVILDNENFNLELVRKGWSPYYTKYGTSPSYHSQFTSAQEEARSRGVNVWHEDHLSAPKKKTAQTRIAAVGNVQGNTKSMVFHTPTCRYFNCKHCTRSFSSRDDAFRAGFSPCGICRP